VVAQRIWFTIPRGAATPRTVRPDGGAAFEVAVDGRRLRGRRWGDGDPVYLLHGWGGSSAQLDALVAPLVQAGFSVVGFDAPSHGASDPGPSRRRRSTILEFAEALRAVAARHGRPYGVVAHSAGATAAAVALRDGLPATRTVFLAPMAHPLAYADQGDRETSWAGGHEIARSWPDARMLSTSRLGHRRILRDPAVIAEVVGFLAVAAPSRLQEAGGVVS
jgi:alpha-beta hydrolase superfamily lysophospholipase